MAVRATNPSTSADDLLFIQDQVAATQLILSGVFDKELKDLRALKQDISIRQGTIDTVKKAELVRLEADAYATKVVNKANEVMQKASQDKAEAQTRINEATEKERIITVDLVNREKQLQQDIQNLADRETAFKIKGDSMDENLKARENILKQDQAQLNSDRQAFQAEQTAFQAKVNAIMGK